MTTNGDCYNCCYQERPLGNLVDSEFEDVWNGKAAQEIRSEFIAGRIPNACLPGIGQCPELGRK